MKAKNLSCWFLVLSFFLFAMDKPSYSMPRHSNLRASFPNLDRHRPNGYQEGPDYFTIMWAWHEAEEKRIVEEDRQIAANKAAHEAEKIRIAQKAQQRKAQAGVDLENLYTNFGSLSAHSLDESKNFITQTTSIIATYPEYFPNAKQRFTNERRIAFKLIYALVIFIAHSDGDARSHLVAAGFTQTELDWLTINRQFGSPAFACMTGGGAGNHGVSLRTIISNHIVF